MWYSLGDTSWLLLSVFLITSGIREFKKLRRLLQRERHIKIELCVGLFQVGHVVQTRRIVLSLAWDEYFSFKGREWKIYCCRLTLSSEPPVRKFHVVVWQTTSKNYTRTLAARAARLLYLIQPIKSLIFGVFVAVAVVKSVVKLPIEFESKLTGHLRCRLISVTSCGCNQPASNYQPSLTCQCLQNVRRVITWVKNTSVWTAEAQTDYYTITNSWKHPWERDFQASHIWPLFNSSPPHPLLESLRNSPPR